MAFAHEFGPQPPLVTKAQRRMFDTRRYVNLQVEKAVQDAKDRRSK